MPNIETFDRNLPNLYKGIEVLKMCYAQGYTDVDKQTGLGVWGTGTFLEDLPPEGGAYDDLPEQADIFTVREEKYKVS